MNWKEFFKPEFGNIILTTTFLLLIYFSNETYFFLVLLYLAFVVGTSVLILIAEKKPKSLHGGYKKIRLYEPVNLGEPLGIVSILLLISIAFARDILPWFVGFIYNVIVLYVIATVVSFAFKLKNPLKL